MGGPRAWRPDPDDRIFVASPAGELVESYPTTEVAAFRAALDRYMRARGWRRWFMPMPAPSLSVARALLGDNEYLHRRVSELVEERGLYRSALEHAQQAHSNSDCEGSCWYPHDVIAAALGEDLKA